MNPELAFTLLGTVVLALLLGIPWWQRLRRKHLGEQPFPAAWRRWLQKGFPLYNHLPPPLQQNLQAMVRVFVAEKPIIGCQGLAVTDTMRVLIAAQACLPVLRLHMQEGLPHPYPELRQVLLYPTPFKVKAKRHEPGGVVSEAEEVRLGESWQEGLVVLSWPDVQEGARSGEWTQLGRGGEASLSPAAGHNVVIHEFAHQLDQESGPANGAPVLRRTQSTQTWAQVFQRAYEDVQWLHEAGERTVIDAYGTTAPEEFFATAAEAFFMTPRALQQQHPDLYDQLRAYFGLDPAGWG